MNKKLLITLTAFITLSTLATAQQGPTVNLDSVLLTADPYPLQSGEDAEISYKIQNTGNTAAENVKVQVIDSYPFSLRPDTKRNYSLGEIKPGESYYITSEVLVAEDSPDGNNSFKVKITNGDFSRIDEVPVSVQSENIELNLANLKTSPSELMPDTENNQLTVDIVNNGEKSAENVVLNLDLPSEFERQSSFSSRQALGTISAGEIKSAQFMFDISENASKGPVEIPGTVSYSQGDSNSIIEESISFETFLSGRPRFEITSVESDLQAGDRGTISMNVENIGSEKSTSTRIRVLDNSDLPFSFTSSNKYVGTLEPGATGEIVFDASVESDSVAKDYLLDFEVRGVKDTEVFVEEKVNTVSVMQADSTQDSLLVPVLLVVLVVLATLGYFFRGKIISKD